MKINGSKEEIALFRGGEPVSSLLDSFGSSLKETRLTATLGYLISLNPASFQELFKLPGRINDVTLEAYHDQGRADIHIRTSTGKVAILEAKLPTIDPRSQSLKYAADYRILLSNHVGQKSGRNSRKFIEISWRQLGEHLLFLVKDSKQIIKIISLELLNHLENHNMIKRRESVEVYARELNNEETLDLFLKGRIYVSIFQKSSNLPEALYFAPHFGKDLARLYPGVQTGISYLARIESVEVAASQREFRALATSHRGKAWLREHAQYLQGFVKKYGWRKGETRSIAFLGDPRLVFNPPVKKEKLQKGKGWLSKRTFSFDELFMAWGR